MNNHYWEIEFIDNGGNTYNNSTLTFNEFRDALTTFYGICKDEVEVPYPTVTGVAIVEVLNDNENEYALIVRDDEDGDWEFEGYDVNEEDIRKKLQEYYLYLRQKSKVCNFSCSQEEESYYLLNYLF